MAIMQKIVIFIQEQGWEITTLEISRYNAAEDHFGPRPEKWEKEDAVWALSISTKPKRAEDIKVREIASSE